MNAINDVIIMNKNYKSLAVIILLSIIVVTGLFWAGYNHGRFTCYNDFYNSEINSNKFISDDMVINKALCGEFGCNSNNNIYNAIDEIKTNEVDILFNGSTVNVSAVRYWDGHFWVFFEVDGYHIINGYKIEGQYP